MKNELSFSPDSAILEKIGFAFSCFDIFTIILEILADSDCYHEKILLACTDELTSGSTAKDYVRTKHEHAYSLFYDCLHLGENKTPSLI